MDIQEKDNVIEVCPQAVKDAPSMGSESGESTEVMMVDSGDGQDDELGKAEDSENDNEEEGLIFSSDVATKEETRALGPVQRKKNSDSDSPSDIRWPPMGKIWKSNVPQKATCRS